MASLLGLRPAGVLFFYFRPFLRFLAFKLRNDACLCMRTALSLPDRLWGTDCQTHVMSVGDPKMSLNSAIPTARCRVAKLALSFFNCMGPGAETLKYITYAATVTTNGSRGDM